MKIKYEKYNDNRSSITSQVSPEFCILDWNRNGSPSLILTDTSVSGSIIIGSLPSFISTCKGVVYSNRAGTVSGSSNAFLIKCTAATTDVRFRNCVFKNIQSSNYAFSISNIGGYSTYTVYMIFENCVIDNALNGQWGGASDLYVIFKNCVIKNSSFGIQSNNIIYDTCICDRDMGGLSSLSYNGVDYTKKIIIGSPMFASTDETDVWSIKTGAQDTITIADGFSLDVIDNRDGDGYRRMARYYGDDYNAPYMRRENLSDPIIGLNPPGVWTPSASSRYWTPSYACNESKRIVLFNNQDYVDLDGNRRNYFDKTINEITLDFTKNGLTKEDMAAVKDIYENSDNEITIYPDENDMTNYIVGRLSKSDLDYFKMINSYWDNGKIDNERFSGVRMVIRVTDDSHFTRSV